MRLKTRCFVLFSSCWLFGLVYYVYMANSESGRHKLPLNSGIERLWPKVEAKVDELDDPALQGIPWRMFDVEAYINKTLLKEGEDKYAKNKFNQEASDNIKMDRDIPDSRIHECVGKEWREDLPATSIIITFHNEARSTLLRTIISVFIRSPVHLIKEIILIDDFSDDPRTGEELTVMAKVKLYRNTKREGLVRSRVKGADAAHGPILTFLDSHCECNEHWLEPLLERVAKDRTRLVSPAIDTIEMNSFDYSVRPSDVKGGFKWNLNFRWDSMTAEEKRSRSDPTEPIKTPAIAGGLFTIDKSWFEELGKYDMEMDIWGGENVEISLRVWLCHGSLEIIPCSKVGHVFRKSFPYIFPANSSCKRNIRRAAEVWLDDYKEYYFQFVPSARYVDFGKVLQKTSGEERIGCYSLLESDSIDARLELKKRLQCKPFKWFLENVYPELRMPEKDEITFGMIRQNDLCVDTMGGRDRAVVNVQLCHGLGGNQKFTFSKIGHLRHDEFCLTVLDSHRSPGSFVKLKRCQTSEQLHIWKRHNDNSMLQQEASNLCLDRSGDPSNGLVVQVCNINSETQKWAFVDNSQKL